MVQRYQKKVERSESSWMNKEDRFDNRESKSEGSAARSIDSSEASCRKDTDADIPQDYLTGQASTTSSLFFL